MLRIRGHNIARRRLPSNQPKAKSLPRIRASASSGISLLDAMADPALFGPWFEKHPETWESWRVFIKALFNLRMDAEQLALYKQCTGRTDPPDAAFLIAYLICGRRAGKSFIIALIAVFLATFYDFTPFLARGERGTVMIVASDRKQARTILRYMRALLKEVPLLARKIEREVADGFDLTNHITIEISTASLRSVRGYTIVCAILEEAAFFSSEEGSASPDVEIVNAIVPAMATIPGALLLVASSPYAKKGILFDAYRQHWGKPSATLVWKAPTRLMNPSVPQSFIDAEYAKDPVSADAEFGANFRNDIEQFVSREVVEACITKGCFERPRESGIKYRGFADPSGGSADSFTIAIAHRDSAGRAILDCVREVKPKFSPDDVCAEFAKVFKSYGIDNKVTGDRYAGIWPVERFKVHGITYEQAAKPKSELYQNLLPVLNSGMISLLDNPRLIAQLVSLERRTSRAGRDQIDHPPGPNSHDDVVNAVAGVIAMLSERTGYVSDLSWVSNEKDEQDFEAWRTGRLHQHIFAGSRGRFFL